MIPYFNLKSQFLPSNDQNDNGITQLGQNSNKISSSIHHSKIASSMQCWLCNRNTQIKMNCDSCNSKGIPSFCIKCYLIIYLGGCSKDEYDIDKVKISCLNCHKILSPQITQTFADELANRMYNTTIYTFSSNQFQKCEICNKTGNIKNPLITRRLLCIDEMCLQKYFN